MVRVLQDLSTLDGGGVAKLLYDYYSNMDHSKVHFDFLIYNYYERGILEEPLKQMGCKIFKVPTLQQDKVGALKAIDEIIKTGNYDCVHSHFGRLSYNVLHIAKKYNVPKRIAHSHIAFEPIPFKTQLAAKPRAFLTKYYATHLFACGRDAGCYMWGKHDMNKGKVKIMKNAIDIDLYRFSDEMRQQKRRELGIDNQLVVGIVGRLAKQKNYPFLFEVYKALLETRDDAILLIVGRGLEEEQIKKQAEAMNLSNYIRFLGVRNDVPELLNAFDVFLLPSLYEGLPVVLIEAQANGVREIISDKVTSEMSVTDLISQIPIDEASIHKWVSVINTSKYETAKRSLYAETVANAGYDIYTASKEMMKFYLM